MMNNIRRPRIFVIDGADTLQMNLAILLAEYDRSVEVVNVGTDGHVDHIDPLETIMDHHISDVYLLSCLDVPPDLIINDHRQRTPKRGKKGKQKKDWHK